MDPATLLIWKARTKLELQRVGEYRLACADLPVLRAHLASIELSWRDLEDRLDRISPDEERPGTNEKEVKPC